MTFDSLLTPDDPSPFTVVNPEGGSRTLFVADHAGREIPARLAGLGIDDWVLDEHVAWDIGSAAVSHALARRFDAILVEATYSRLVVDCNRDPSDPTSIAEVSDGIAIPGNIDLPADEREQRLREIFRPYHNAVNAQIDRLRGRGVTPALVSIHSCTPVFDRLVRPWHLGVLWDKDPRIAVPLLQHLREIDGVCVGDNEPYSGKDPHDYTIDTHAEAERIPHVAIEVRQDLISDAEGAAHWAGVLGDALAPILADDGLYTPFVTDR